MKRTFFWCAAVAFSFVGRLSLAQSIQLQPGDSVAICGDSITEQKEYSAVVEEYLLACKPKSNLTAMQFGWGGETSWGFAGRVENDVLRFKPTVATTCYGMNDGGYRALEPQTAKNYRDTTLKLIETFKANGVRAIVIGSPGAVDTDTFRKGLVTPEIYNKTLGELRDIAKEVAQQAGVGFADVHQTMLDAMAKFKVKFPNQPFAGKDGVHPGPNGHVAMAYAFLKALGCDGDIGTITVDATAGKAEATDGHVIKSAEGNTANAGTIKVTVESSRYPYFFAGKIDDPTTARAAAQFLPFNDDLNRFRLVVTGVTGKAKVTWGDASKEFTSEALGKGINLADEFPDSPFKAAWVNLHKAVRAQQDYETPAIKELIHSMPRYRNILPEQKQILDQLNDAAMAKAKTLNAASVAAVTPVTHTITIQAIP